MRGSAFVHLLIVIVIVTVLAGLLLPAIRRMKQAAEALHRSTQRFQLDEAARAHADHGTSAAVVAPATTRTADVRPR